jgi:glycosyltransferase involved in cell wall biosynthesis
VLHHFIPTKRICETYLANMIYGFGIAAPYIATLRWKSSYLAWLIVSILRIFKYLGEVAIAPMQSGSGIQNKILEAMASGLPVVTTTLGIGSLKAEPGREILVADSPEKFAKTVIGLLQNGELAEAIGYQASKFVAEKHSWELAANQIEDLYLQTLSQKEFSYMY